MQTQTQERPSPVDVAIANTDARVRIKMGTDQAAELRKLGQWQLQQAELIGRDDRLLSNRFEQAGKANLKLATAILENMAHLARQAGV